MAELKPGGITIRLDQGIVLNGEDCTIEDIYQIAYKQVPVYVADECWTRVRQAREVVNRMLALEEPVYGLNTGLGSLKKFSLSADELGVFNRDVILSHSVPMDTQPLGIASVRAVMASRINGLIRGGTGVRPELVQMLVDMLNRGVYPIVHGRCVSVGESDLSPLAEIGLVMIGEGNAFYQGQLISGREALTRAACIRLCCNPKRA
ncbi:MAG: aromatic amino acid lyase [Chloroflexaceae bacterium]|nr:aromatic amino acid lyase [Chloroflexaceae bacterium]